MNANRSLQNSAATTSQFNELLQELMLEDPAKMTEDSQLQAKAKERIVHTERRDLYYIQIQQEYPPVRLVAMEYPPNKLHIIQVEVYDLQYTGMFQSELRRVEDWLNATGVLKTLKEQKLQDQTDRQEGERQPLPEDIALG